MTKVKTLNRLVFSGLCLCLCLASLSVYVLAQPANPIIYQPDLDSLAEGETLPDQLYVEGAGFFADGNGGLVSTTNNEYNAIYFGTTARQFHFHAVMEPVVPGTSVVGGLSFKTFSFEEGKRMDLAVTTGTNDKSILIYAFGMLLADNRNEAQGGLGGQAAYDTTGSVTIDLYGDRNYYAVFINGVMVIETILPLEGTGAFGIRSQNSLIRYSDIYIEELGETLLDGTPRYYPETFETIELAASKLIVKKGEPFTVSALLEPAGKDYDDVAWYIDDAIVFGETALDFDLEFTTAGTVEVSCIVDRQKAVLEITVLDEDYQTITTTTTQPPVTTAQPTVPLTTTTITTTAPPATTSTAAVPAENPSVGWLVGGITTVVAGMAAGLYFLILRKRK